MVIHPRDGGEYIRYSPSNKSVGRIKQKVGELLERRNGAPWEEVCQKLNQKLRGWQQYFHCGSTSRTYKAVDEHVYDRVRNFLRRRHKVSSQGPPVPRGTGVWLVGGPTTPGAQNRAYVSLR